MIDTNLKGAVAFCRSSLYDFVWRRSSGFIRSPQNDGACGAGALFNNGEVDFFLKVQLLVGVDGLGAADPPLPLINESDQRT